LGINTQAPNLDTRLGAMLRQQIASETGHTRKVSWGDTDVNFMHCHRDWRNWKSPHSNSLEFVAHGMGLISHEAPRLTDRGPIPYPAYDADLPLERGMVLSIETTLLHPRRGFIKLEDTVAVTETGCEGFGDRARGWNRGGR
jgi:Xaa-Pro aminopeptidase